MQSTADGLELLQRCRLAYYYYAQPSPRALSRGKPLLSAAQPHLLAYSEYGRQRVGELLSHVAILLKSQHEVEAVIASYSSHVSSPHVVADSSRSLDIRCGHCTRCAGARVAAGERTPHRG